MQCDICGKKKATVHLTEIVDDQMTEMHLCEDCARERSVQMEQQFGLADLLAGLTDFGKQVKGYEQVQLKCPRCGMGYDDFKKFGRLGCGDCYTAFEENLASLLKKIHGSSHHMGKTPQAFTVAGKEKMDTLRDLKNMLQQAIQSEDFERAADLRDKIRILEKQENKDKT
jgi:protein arginine kinase activator